MCPKSQKPEPFDLAENVPGFSVLALKPPFRPALRDGVRGGGATALSCAKIERLDCPENRAKK